MKSRKRKVKISVQRLASLDCGDKGIRLIVFGFHLLLVFLRFGLVGAGMFLMPFCVLRLGIFVLLF